MLMGYHALYIWDIMHYIHGISYTIFMGDHAPYFALYFPILPVVGGYSGSARDEVLMYNGTWSEVGRMQLRRWGASASPVMIDTTGPVDISGCS